MNVFFHSKDNLKKSVISYILCLLPLYLYGIYKNGILLYNKNAIGFIGIFKLIYLLLIGILVYAIVNIIFKKKLKIDLEFLSLFIIPLFMMPNVSFLIYGIGMFIGLIIINVVQKYLRININKIAFIKLLIVLLMLLFSVYSYENNLESMNIYAFNIFDLMWGRNIGGLGSTSIILSVIIMLILAIINNYKYIICVGAISTLVIFSLIFHEYSFFITSAGLVPIIFVATDLESTPVSKKWCLVNGIIVGLVGFFLMKYVNIYEGMFLSILICNVIGEFVCKNQKKML